METSNPVLSAQSFRTARYSVERENAMSIQGVVLKTALLLLLVCLSAAWTWNKFFMAGQNAAVVTPWMLGGAIGGFIVAMVTVFKQQWSMITAPLYAVLEGLFIGGISAVLNAAYPGIAIQAAGLTFATLFVMLAAYQTGLIKATERFKLGVVAATGGIALVYFVSIILGFFGISVPFIYESGIFGIGFSLFVCAIAALNLVLDFDLIEQGAKRGLPKYMEWYSSFALMVTLIWLYIEILRLLSKMREK